jgi:N-sulfoglucosamine sulfohydrolase
MINYSKHFLIILCFLFGLNISSDPRPNILIIMADDMSPKINALGDKTAITPNIDKLVESGKSYINAFTTAGVCACSRSSLLTGKNQISIGAMHMRTSTRTEVPYLAVPDSNIKAFPEILRKFGYFTFTNDKLDYQFSGILPGTGPFTIWNSEDSFYGWKERQTKQPFFGIINLTVTHESGLFVGKMNSALATAIKLRQKAIQFQYDAPVKSKDVNVPAFLPDTKEIREDIARVYNNIYILDLQVKEILDELKADGLIENTIIIFTSDHGDGLPRYKRELFDTGINVPLIMVIPDKFNKWETDPNSKSERLISFLDIAPTILDLAGISVPEYMDGISFFSSNENRYIFAARDRLDNQEGKVRAIRDKRYKLIKNFSPGIVGAQKLEFRENLQSVKKMRSMLNKGTLTASQKIWFEKIPEVQLYDLWRDPNEVQNLANKESMFSKKSELEDALDNWIKENDVYANLLEDDLSEKFWPNAKQPITDIPVFHNDGEFLIVENTNRSNGASIGYSYDGKKWKVYSGPIRAYPRKNIFLKSVKYGWRESEVVKIEF